MPKCNERYEPVMNKIAQGDNQPEIDALEGAGEVCVSTHRIVIISPHPSSLHELVGELSAQCCDVLVFHKFSQHVLAKLQLDALIIDQPFDIAALGQYRNTIDASIPICYLVPAQDGRQCGERLLAEDAVFGITWPKRVQTVWSQVERIIEQNGMSDAKRMDQGQATFKDLVIDYRRFVVMKEQVRIELTRTEFDLLKVLLAADGSTLSRQEIMDQIWGEHYFGGSNIVDVHVKSLRQKLGDDSKKPRYISTVRGVGYRIADDI
ncbi:winged helix-turn-helix domain-containing protein [Paenibacillus sp. 481]|uniref:winged helix-turn-helix domain-containing protein n=1 Tax=Paenibacillus sp. 481 TaxID=2835869 RepID=UPI001E2A6BC5|nr:winged helix-turn-helix domain-containing protein [Paenibacillus sp. 481]UHA72771.1 winged helix-turn-helix transcriptional regulator [Paenibacillus sp. 481]